MVKLQEMASQGPQVFIVELGSSLSNCAVAPSDFLLGLVLGVTKGRLKRSQLENALNQLPQLTLKIPLGAKHSISHLEGSLLGWGYVGLQGDCLELFSKVLLFGTSYVLKHIFLFCKQTLRFPLLVRHLKYSLNALYNAIHAWLYSLLPHKPWIFSSKRANWAYVSSLICPSS